MAVIERQTVNETIAWLAICKKRSPWVSYVRCIDLPQLGAVGLGVDCNGCEIWCSSKRFTEYLMTMSDSFTSWLTRVRSSMLTRRALALGCAATRRSASKRELLARACVHYPDITKRCETHRRSIQHPAFQLARPQQALQPYHCPRPEHASSSQMCLSSYHHFQN